MPPSSHPLGSGTFAPRRLLHAMPHEVVDACPELLSALDGFVDAYETTEGLETVALGALGQRFVVLHSEGGIANASLLAAYIERELIGDTPRGDAIATGFLEGASRGCDREKAIAAIRRLGPLARAFCAEDLSLPKGFDWDVVE